MKLWTVVLAFAVLFGFAVPVGAQEDPDTPSGYHTVRSVCVSTAGVDGVACATAHVFTTVNCYGLFSGRRCDLESTLSLTVNGPSGDVEARGLATSQGTPGEEVVAWSGTTAEGEAYIHTYRDIPDGGSTVVYWNTVCIEFALSPSVGGDADVTGAEPQCESWPHSTWLPPEIPLCGFCNDFISQYRSFAGIADAQARNLAASTGPAQDRSIERVCGVNTRVDIGCGWGWVAHSSPTCSSSMSTRTCTVEYWLHVDKTAIGVGCATVHVNSIPNNVTSCGFQQDVGPFQITYSNVPAGGLDVDVWATVCLGNGTPQGWDENGYTDCTIWSPATIRLPGG